MKGNIAIIAQCMNTGGAERIAGYLSKYLSDSYNVYLLLANTDDMIYEHGGTVIEIDEKSIERELVYYKKKLAIDCSISFLDRYNAANVMSRVNDKVIISQRSTLTRYMRNSSLPGSGYAMLYREADAIVACSYGVREDLANGLRLDADKITVIYNYIDKEAQKRLSLEMLPERIKTWLGNDKYILNVSRLIEAKNQMMLVRQFAWMHKEFNTGLKLIILGKGPLESVLKEEIKNNSMDGKILLAPHADNPFPFYKGADCFVLPSRWEGLPNVLIESMLAGKPSVAADCMSGPRELLDDRTNYDKPVEGIMIGKRGILTVNSEDECFGNTHFFGEAMHRMEMDKDMRERMLENITSYMDGYNNDLITRQWREVIEDCRNTEDKRDFIVEDTMIDMASSIIIYGAG